MNHKKTALISTLFTQGHGGVYTKLSFLVSVLQEMDYEVKLAYYLPYSIKSELSVPAKKLFRHTTQMTHFFGELGVEEYAIGAFLPELEFINYYPNAHWKKIIDESDAHIVVSGNILSALPFYVTQKKYVAWIGSAYTGDRKNRIRTFPWYRKCIDFLLISPISIALEKKLLHAGTVFSVSGYTKTELNKHRQNIRDVIPVPIDTTLFFPVRDKVKPVSICFTGRFLDPRKNVELLLNAFCLVKKNLPNARLYLVGDDITPALTEKLNTLCIAENVQTLKYTSQSELISILQKTDVFVIPSYQEGLCISGLEALACGCPVVSTKCGGPSDYIFNEVNGYLVNFDADALAEKIITICSNREKRNQMSEAAVNIIQEKYSINTVKKKWMNIIQAKFE